MSQQVQFGSKAAADHYREEYPEYVCPADDDRRLKTVAFVSDAPGWLMEQARLEADEGRAERETRSHTAELGAGERERIKNAGGFKGMATHFNWQSAKGTFAREGLTDQFHDAIPALADYDDPAEGAEEWIRENKEFDALHGTQSASGGARDVGEEDVQSQRKAARAAKSAQSDRCNHARGHCENGDADACEFLTDACGFDQDEVQQLLADQEDAQTEDGELPGRALGALKQAWGGYHGATAELAEALEMAGREWRHAQQAADAVNSIREAHGQDPIHFEKLEGAQAKLADLVREAAADCFECHADHTGHDHPTEQDAREELAEIGGPTAEAGGATTQEIHG